MLFAGTTYMSKPENSTPPPRMVRPPAELVYGEELAALACNDNSSKPPGWRLSPRAVRQFIVGAEAPLAHSWQGNKKKTAVTQKHYFDAVVKARGKGSKTWQQFYEAKKWLRG